MARRYWREKRGLSDAAIRRFGLGYAPEDFVGLLHYLRHRGFTEPELESSGLVKRSAKGNLYDIFRHRVMVPIIDVRGNIIAFGGRVMDDSKPKYINSPETMVYHKSRTLFALNVAKKSTSKRYILCEGYMDVISMHEAGFDTAVCACGTALTPEQVKRVEIARLIDAARGILSETASGEDADLLLESAEQKIYDIRSGRDKPGVKTIKESILEVIDTMQKLSGADRDKFAGIPTGFNYLDTVLTGLGRSDLIILAARPGMGKTSFALNIATNVARQQKVPTIIFSLEMTCEQLTDRILSSTANIDSQAFRTGRLNNSDWNDFAQATSMLYNAPIYMDDSSGISVPEIKAKIRTINQDPKKEKIGLVIIDYLQLMQSAKRTESRVQEISDITRNLKIMAKELADIVLFLYRAAYYNSQNGEDSQANENEAECIVAKNRHGETSVVRLGWDGAHTRFSNLDVAHEF